MRTGEGTKPMTPQEILYKTAAHCFAQNERAVGSDDRCLYETNAGLKCAIGCHLSNETLQCVGKRQMDVTHLVAFLNENIVLPDVEFLVTNTKLLQALQCAHDISYNWRTSEMMRKEFNLVAKWFKLEPLPDSSEYRFANR